MTRRLFLSLLFSTAPVVTSGCGPLDGPFFGGRHAEPSDPPPPEGRPLEQPTFGPTVTAAAAPPVLSGGTLVVAGATALAADPDRDRILLVDVDQRAVRATVALQAGDEPGRAAVDVRGNFHVVLRGAGAIADVDAGDGRVVRRPVCAAPRGIAYDALVDELLVACAGGELLRLPAAGGPTTAKVWIEPDLRDVVIDQDRTVYVTTLRSARITVIDATGAGEMAQTIPRDSFGPAVAWRTVALPGHGVLVAHQRAATTTVKVTQGGYGDAATGCQGSDGIVHASVAVMDRTEGALSFRGSPGPILAGVVLPVDVAISKRGSVAIVSAGSAHIAGRPQVVVLPIEALRNGGELACVSSLSSLQIAGQAVAAGYDASGDLWVQTREPATLQVFAGGTSRAPPVIVPLGGESRADTGWAIFHSDSGAGLACASCHPEGGDDARTWSFDPLGPRRTQSLRGGVTGRAPFHWSGDEPDFHALADDVFARRMGGPRLADSQVAALLRWVDSVPTVPSSQPADPDAVARGHAIFDDPTAGCASCHAGAKLTNGAKADVGTPGGAFKVPSLVNLWTHPPYLHDGCALTLRARFSAPCRGTAHGNTSQLGDAQIDDLTAYLATL